MSEHIEYTCHIFLQQALRDVQPSAKREGFATIPDVTWDDIGALEDIREELTMAIIVSLRWMQYVFSEIYAVIPHGTNIRLIVSLCLNVIVHLHLFFKLLKSRAENKRTLWK